MKRQSEPILQVLDGEIILDMNMDTRDFAQARLLPHMEESGWIASRSGEKDGGWTFRPWTFLETREKQGCVQVAGKDFSGRTLLSVLDPSGKAPTDEAVECVRAVVGAMEAAISQEVRLPNPGPAGTLLSGDGSILFLPETLFTRAAETRPQEEYSRVLGCWTNPALSWTEGLRFTEAVYAYRCLSGELPFPLPYTVRRHEDYFDQNFLPLALAVPGADATLADAVDTNLSRQGAIRVAKRNAKSLRVQRATAPCKAVPSELIAAPAASPTDLERAALERDRFIKRQRRRVARARFVRRHSTALRISAAAAAALVLAFAVYLNDRQDSYTAVGLSARQTAQALYTGTNTLDVAMLQALCKGKETTWLLDSVSAFYVTAKVRETSEQNVVTLTPAEWLYMNSGDKFIVYGVTGLKLDGKEAVPDVRPSVRRDKPVPVTHEAGAEIADGDRREFSAEFNLVHTLGGGILTVERCSDAITLEYRKDSWRVVSVERSSEPHEVGIGEFQEDFLRALEQSGGSVKGAAESLRGRYGWLPGGQSLTQAAEAVYGRFQTPAAAYDLGILRQE